MKIAMIIVRTLMGLLFLFSSVSFFLIMMGVLQLPPMEGSMKTFFEGLAASGYFFALLKVTEFVCGFLLLIGRYVPLVMLILSPVIINIFLTHLFLQPEGIGPGAFLVVGNIFLAYYYWDAFRPLLRPTFEPTR
jgi:uncharacterized membrane protein YphA (DoxX/SURF4 family)